MNILETILEAATDDPSARPEFYRVLLESPVFVLTNDDPGDERQRSIRPGETLHFMSLLDRHDRRFVPCFSSLEKLYAAAREEQAYIRLVGHDFFRMVGGCNVVLNPFSECSKIFGGDETAQLADGTFLHTVEKQTIDDNLQVLIAELQEIPEALVCNLRALFSKYHSVRRAYLIQFALPESTEDPHTLVIIDAPDAPEQVFQDAGMVAADSLEPDTLIDFMPYHNDTFCQHVAEDISPFYERAHALV